MNKGMAIAGDTLFWATVDCHLLAIDAKTGHVIWDKLLADFKKGYQYNVAPLVVRNMVILGPATNEAGANCWVSAYDIKTGKELWRFYTAPMSADAARSEDLGRRFLEAWRQSYLEWRHLRSRNQPDVLGHRQSESRLERRPAHARRQSLFRLRHRARCRHRKAEVVLPVHARRRIRLGFDAGSGARRHGLEGQPRKLMLWANRNGFFYVLDRTTGEFLTGQEFRQADVESRIRQERPSDQEPSVLAQADGRRSSSSPGTQGGTNWYPPSYSPRTGLFYIPTWENSGGRSAKGDPGEWKEGQRYTGIDAAGRRRRDRRPRRRGRLRRYKKEEEGYGAIRALDPKTGDEEVGIQDGQLHRERRALDCR